MDIQNHAGLRFHIFGEGNIDLVIEMGLGAAMGEWWHVASSLSRSHTVLLYERSRSTKVARTPENIAGELFSLLAALPCAARVILLAHSQGGLYAAQFARLYPQRVRGLVLLDPLSPFDSRYRELLTPEEQAKSGFDKSANLVMLQKLAKLHLGAIIKATMKKAPPFYYYSDFSRACAQDILSSLTRPELYESALAEYRLAHEEAYTAPLQKKEGFPNVPLALAVHSRDFSIRETMEFGRASRELAEKVEDVWQSLMGEYLAFSDCAKRFQAKSSGHYLHLTEPELIAQSLAWVESHP